jgi:hypothetical protein
VLRGLARVGGGSDLAQGPGDHRQRGGCAGSGGSVAAPAREVARLGEVVAVGEGDAGTGGVPRGIQPVIGLRRQVVGLEIQVGRPFEVAAVDRDVAERLQCPAAGDRGQALRGLKGSLRAGFGGLKIAPVASSESCGSERPGVWNCSAGSDFSYAIARPSAILL